MNTTSRRLLCLIGTISMMIAGRPLLAQADTMHDASVHSAIFEDLRVQSFFGADFRDQESRNKDVYERTRLVSVLGEWAPYPWLSLYLRVPYGDIVHTDRDRTFYLDHIRGGVKFQLGTPTFGALFGMFGDAARGHNKVGDVPANYGALEPYAGMYFDMDRVYLQGAIRWNTETTARMMEQPGEDFRRTWLGDGSVGIRVKPVTLMLDARYHFTYDPAVAAKKYLEVGPGIDWHIGAGMHLTAAATLFTASQSKNRGGVVAFRKFID